MEADIKVRSYLPRNKSARKEFKKLERGKQGGL